MSEINWGEGAEEVDWSEGAEEVIKKRTPEELAKFRADNQAQIQQEIEAARLAAIVEENPILSKIFPRVAENIGSGDVEADSWFNAGAILPGAADITSSVGRTGLASVATLGNILGNQDQRPLSETFTDELMAKTGGEITTGYPVIDAVGNFGEDIVRDPITPIPLGPAVAGLKYISKTKPVVAAAEKLGATKVGEVLGKFGEKLNKPIKEAISKRTDNLTAAETTLKEVMEARAAQVRKAQDILDRSPKTAEDVADYGLRVSKINSATGPAIREAEAAVKAAQPLITPGAKTLGADAYFEGTVEAGLEGLRQQAEGEDINLGSIMAAAVIPGALQATGKGLQAMGKSALASKLKFKPNLQDRRYGANSDIILEQGIMPWGGGSEGIASAVQNKLADINTKRALETEELVSKSLPDVAADGIDYINQPIIDSQRFDWMITPEGREQYGKLINQISDARNAGANYAEVFANAKREALKLLGDKQLTPDLYDKVMDEIYKRENALMASTGIEPILRVQETPVDPSFLAGVERGSGEVPMGRPSLGEINLMNNPLYSVGAGSQGFLYGYGPVTELNKESRRLFTEGKVNRPTSNVDPAAPSSIAAEIMYDQIRPEVNKFLDRSSKEYAQWLPVDEALTQAAPRIGNSGWTGIDITRPAQWLGQTNPVIKSTYDIGRILEGAGQRFESFNPNPLRQEQDWGSDATQRLLGDVIMSGRRSITRDEEDKKKKQQQKLKQ